MHILLFGNERLPALKYGGTERVMWWLGKELSRRGYRVTYLVAHGSHCPFARVLVYDPDRPLEEQVPADVDVLHAHQPIREAYSRPYLVTVHSNVRTGSRLNQNSVFISANHAARYGASCYVYHGIDPEEYGRPDFSVPRRYAHFLGKAAWKVKNVRGAIDIARRSRTRLTVLGGYRLNLKMGFRLTLDTHVRFHGMVGGPKKNRLINGSMALIFPVLWNEPFGLAVIESLYFGCPVLATPNGSLPELVTSDVGVISNSRDELASALGDTGGFDARRCHEYVRDQFTSGKMTLRYLDLYERVLRGEPLNAVQPLVPERPGRLLSWET